MTISDDETLCEACRADDETLRERCLVMAIRMVPITEDVTGRVLIAEGLYRYIRTGAYLPVRDVSPASRRAPGVAE